MRTFRRTALCVSAALTTTLFAACSSGTPAASVTAADAANAKLTIGISFDQPGLGLKTGNTYSGFDVDTAVYVAKQLGVPSDAIAWREADPADRENLLVTGAVDLVFSTYSITPEREKKVSFPGPYFTAHQDLLIRRNDVSITGPDTLDGKKLCSVTGTTSAELITKKYLGKINLLPLSKFSDCVSALANGNVDAVTTDDVILAGFAAQPQVQGPTQGRRARLLHRELRGRHQEGGHRDGHQGQRRPEEVHRRRVVEDVAGVDRWALRLPDPRPAHPRQLSGDRHVSRWHGTHMTR